MGRFPGGTADADKAAKDAKPGAFVAAEWGPPAGVLFGGAALAEALQTEQCLVAHNVTRLSGELNGGLPLSRCRHHPGCMLCPGRKASSIARWEWYASHGACCGPCWLHAPFLVTVEVSAAGSCLMLITVLSPLRAPLSLTFSSSVIDLYKHNTAY